MKTTLTQWALSRIVVCAVTIAAFAPLSADADVQYKMDVHIEKINAPIKPRITLTNSVKGLRKRTEFQIEAGPVRRRLITLTLPDKKQMIRINPDKKIYTVLPFDPDSDELASVLNMIAKQKEDGTSDAKPDSGSETKNASVTRTYTVQKLGEEKVKNYTTQHYKQTVQTEMSGFQNDRNRTTRMEIWTTSVPTGLDTVERLEKERVMTDTQERISTYRNQGDIKMAQEIRGYIPARIVVYGEGDSKTAQIELASLSEKTLDDTLFDVPADYQEVSPEEFREDQQKQKQQRKRGGLFRRRNP